MGKKIERICRECGERFLAEVSQVNLGGGIFCSRDCRWASRRLSPKEILVNNSKPTSVGCLVWTGGLDTHGYGIFRIRRNGKLQRRLAHRVAWETFRGKIPKGLSVLHNCPQGDNRACINVEHLWLGTQAENVADAVKKKRFPHGENHTLAKLTETQVLSIRTMFAEGAQIREVQKAFGIAHATPSNIKNGHTWKHLLDGT